MSVGAMNTPAISSVWDDPLIFLPRRKVQRFQRDQAVYRPDDPADSLYLVVEGMIKRSRISDSGRETVLDFCSADNFFGESALMGRPMRGELAVALEDSSVMEWTRDELAHLMMRTPELGPSLLGVLATKLDDADTRIESLATDQISQRLVKVLLRLGDQVGTPSGSTSLHLMPLTHELLARYVGTSREIITQHMSQLRRDGVLDYSRAGIDFNPTELRETLHTN